MGKRANWGITSLIGMTFERRKNSKNPVPITTDPIPQTPRFEFSTPAMVTRDDGIGLRVLKKN